jgi:hypothetical protein
MLASALPVVAKNLNRPAALLIAEQMLTKIATLDLAK